MHIPERESESRERIHYHERSSTTNSRKTGHAKHGLLDGADLSTGRSGGSRGRGSGLGASGGRLRRAASGGLARGGGAGAGAAAAAARADLDEDLGGRLLLGAGARRGGRGSLRRRRRGSPSGRRGVRGGGVGGPGRRGSGSRGWLGLLGGRGGRVSTTVSATVSTAASIFEAPGASENTDGRVSEEVEKASGHVEATPWASGTLISDLCCGGLPVDSDLNHLEAMILLLVLSLVKGDNELIGSVYDTTSTKASIEERVPDIVELVTLSNRSRCTLSKSMVLSPVQVRMARESRCSNGSKAQSSSGGEEHG